MAVTIVGDYADDYLSAAGVEDGSYAPTDGGEAVTGVKAQRGSLTKTDFASATFAISSTDVPWIVWNTTLAPEELEINGELTIRGKVWIVVGIVSERPDGAQTRAIFRLKRTVS